MPKYPPMNTPLTQLIQDEITHAGGAISFTDFMEIALYHPEWGYYCRTENFTQDFTTAPEISPLFSQCLAAQISAVLQTIENGDILELGAGTGVLAKNILLQLEQLKTLPRKYFILEISASLRDKQKALLTEACPHLINRVEWLDYLPEELNGVILANEVLDALPVNLFVADDAGGKERCVTWQDDQFTWVDLTSTNEMLNEKITHLTTEYNLPPGYSSEINLAALQLIETLGLLLNKGVILFVDYGYGQREYYHPDRTQGTLTCFHQHTRNNNPLQHPGEQDITAHVDFTSIAEKAITMGLTLEGYTTQGAFLLGCGLMSIAEQQAQTMDVKEQYRQSQGIKQLILPSEMGERIKVIGFSKDWDGELIGFSLSDRRVDL